MENSEYLNSMDIKKRNKSYKSTDHTALLFEGLDILSLTERQDLISDTVLLVVEYNGELCLYANF